MDCIILSWLHHDVEQCILFRGNSPPYSRRVLSLCVLFLANLSCSLHSIKLIPDLYVRTMMWSSTYCFEVTVQGILALMPLWKFHKLTPPIDYIRSSWNIVKRNTIMWSSTYHFEVTVHHIFLPTVYTHQAERWFMVRSWCEAAHFVLRLQSTKYKKNYVCLFIRINFSFRANPFYSTSI